MIIPTVMGCPLWIGPVKARVAKKHLSGGFRNPAFVELMSRIKPGDLINDCSSFNVRIARIEPRYYNPGRLHATGFQVLLDIDITNDRGGSCSFQHCGVEPARPREELVADWDERIKFYIANGDEWHFAKRYEFTTITPDGQAVTDWKAMWERYPETKQ